MEKNEKMNKLLNSVLDELIGSGLITETEKGFSLTKEGIDECFKRINKKEDLK